jgi:hypothetical protein
MYECSTPSETITMRRRGALSFVQVVFVLVATSLAATGCDAPVTRVVVENRSGAVIQRARWHAVELTEPIAPGAASAPRDTVPASETPAYALRGEDPAALVVLRSRAGFAVGLNQTLTIVVDDTTFAGDCAAGSPLEQREADFITERVFASVFAGLRYDAATCTTVEAP